MNNTVPKVIGLFVQKRTSWQCDMLNTPHHTIHLSTSHDHVFAVPKLDRAERKS